MKLLISVMMLLSVSGAFAKNYSVVNESSKIDWHLYIDSGTDVYGEIPVIKGNFDLEKSSGELKFDLAKTKSWEMEDGKKAFSDARDSRIVSITDAEDNIPTFVLSGVSGYNAQAAESTVEFSGKLSLNGKTKDVKLKGTLAKNGESLKLKASYKLMWKDFKIDNPVIWILRVSKTPQDFITINFNLDLK